MTATSGSPESTQQPPVGSDGLGTAPGSQPGIGASGRQTGNDDTDNLTGDQKKANQRVESNHSLSIFVRKIMAALLVVMVIFFGTMVWKVLWGILQNNPIHAAAHASSPPVVERNAVPSAGTPPGQLPSKERLPAQAKEVVASVDALAVEQTHAAHLLFAFALSAAIALTLSAIAALMKLTRDPPEDSKGPLLNSTVSELLEAIGKIFEMLKSR